jgi:hypothetical protein
MQGKPTMTLQTSLLYLIDHRFRILSPSFAPNKLLQLVVTSPFTSGDHMPGPRD